MKVKVVFVRVAGKHKIPAAWPRNCADPVLVANVFDAMEQIAGLREDRFTCQITVKQEELPNGQLAEKCSAALEVKGRLSDGCVVSLERDLARIEPSQAASAITALIAEIQKTDAARMALVKNQPVREQTIFGSPYIVPSIDQM